MKPIATKQYAKDERVFQNSATYGTTAYGFSQNAIGSLSGMGGIGRAQRERNSLFV